jgi:two-component system, LytTR family, response regulator LytT
MKILIIEDEQPAARRLSKMIANLDPQIEIAGITDSIETSIKWLHSVPAPDLIFSDIQLSDGLSFEIFKQIKTPSPIIFTTAYDEYAINAFKLNSIDYLLKPIKETELQQAYEKYQKLHAAKPVPSVFQAQMETMLQKMMKKNYKERFLIKYGDKLFALDSKDIHYFFSENGLTFIMTRNEKKYMIDHTLEELENLLDPHYFFRLNRQFLTNFQGIRSINTHLNGKLKINLDPDPQKEVFISREKASVFKEWLDK